MNGYYRDLIKILKAHGYYFLRHGRGDHEIWFNGKTIFTVDKKKVRLNPPQILP